MRKAIAGFTLIEAVIFIIVTGLMMNTFIVGTRTLLANSPKVHNQKIALDTARGCMEWYLGQRLLSGYSVYACPSTPTSTNCSAPTGFSVATNITCSTINSDANYKTITVSVTGLASASLTTLVGNY